MIRPFRRERVTFPPSKSPLTAGLTTGDIVMQSGKRINDFSGDIYLASDVFSYVVDYDDVAPFAKFPEAKHFGYGESGNDHNPLNMVNGFVSADGWQYIFSIPIKEGVPRNWTISLPKPQEIVEFEWVGNAFYNPITKVELGFDGRKDDAPDPRDEARQPAPNLRRQPPAHGERHLDQPRRLGQGQPRPPSSASTTSASRPPGRKPSTRTVRPMLNIGGLMEYRKGTGGVVLCNVLYQESESVPENLAKKRRDPRRDPAQPEGPLQRAAPASSPAQISPIARSTCRSRPTSTATTRAGSATRRRPSRTSPPASRPSRASRSRSTISRPRPSRRS